MPDISERELKKLIKAADLILKHEGEQINETQACELLGISPKTLKNYISNGTISPDMFTVGVGGNKFFFKQKLINTKSPVYA